MIKMIYLLHRRSDMDVEEFKKYYSEVHAPIAMKLPGLRRYIQNYPNAEDGENPPACDAVSEMWWDDMEAMQKSSASPEGQAAQADMQNFLDSSRLQVFSVEEAEII